MKNSDDQDQKSVNELFSFDNKEEDGKLKKAEEVGESADYDEDLFLKNIQQGSESVESNLSRQQQVGEQLSLDDDTMSQEEGGEKSSEKEGERIDESVDLNNQFQALDIENTELRSNDQAQIDPINIELEPESFVEVENERVQIDRPDIDIIQPEIPRDRAEQEPVAIQADNEEEVSVLEEPEDEIEINLAPTDITLTSQTISEFAEAGDVVGVINIIDTDSTNDFNIEISGQGSEFLQIIGNDIVVKDGVELNHEKFASLDINILVTDDFGNEYSEQFSITIVDENDEPVIREIAPTTTITDIIEGQILVSDEDESSQAIFEISEGFNAPDGFNLNSDGSYSFDPNHNTYDHLNIGDAQVITIPVIVTDDQGATDTAQIQITVKGSNDAPEAGAEVFTSLSEGEAIIEGQITATDIDDNSTLVFSISEGSSTPDGFNLNNDGTYSFDASNSAYNDLKAGETSQIEIPITVTDEHGATDQSKIQVTITGTNDSPVASTTITSNIDEDTSFVISSNDLLANATDIDGDGLNLSSVQDAEHGTVEINSDGNIVFTPVENYNGEASFSYTISDGNGGTDTATVTLNVDSVNDVITQVTDINSDANEVKENLSAGAGTGVTLNATDVDGDEITYSVEDGVPFTVNENGEIVTTEALDFETTDSYTFDVIATSADGSSSTQSITIDVNDIDDIAYAGTVTIATVSGDDVINAQEDNAATIEVTGTASGGDIAEGDQVTVTVNGTDYTTTVQNDGSYSVDVATSDLQADTSIEAKVDSSDDAGNEVTSNASTHTVSFDSTADAGTVSVSSITDDDIINASESNSTIEVSGTAIGGDISEGDAVSFTVNGTDYSTTVQADGNWSVDVAGTDLAADTKFDVSVESIDDAGNSVTSTTTSTHSVDNSAEAGTVTIATVSGDDVINAQEDNAATIEVTGTASGGDIAQGDQVTVTVNGQDYTTTVQGDGSYSVDVATSDLQADTSIDAKVDSSDAAGNAVTSNATSHNVSFDSSADAGTVTVSNITADDVVNATEDDSDITVSGTASGGDIAEGDAVSFTVNGNDYETTVDADGNWSVDVAGADLAADSSFDITVESSDDAGNSVTSTTTSTHMIDNSADAGTVTIATVSGDDVINASEDNAATIEVTGSASGGDISEGDSVTVSVNSNDYTTTVQGDGSYSVDVATSDLQADTSIDAKVDSSDTAGNAVTSNATSHNVSFDSSADAGTVTVSNITADDVVNATEDDSDIIVSGTASGGDIAEGDAVSFTVNGNDYETTVDADGNWSVDVAGADLANDTSFDVNIASSDDAGNTVTSTTTSTHTVDSSADAGTVTIGTVSGDDVINAQEDNAATIEVTGTASGGDIAEGDSVTVTVNGNDYTTTVQNDGSYSVNVATSDLQADTSIDAKVDSSDAAGNVVTSNATTHTISFDSSADAGTVTVSNITTDDVVNATEDDSDIAVSGTALGGDIAEGDDVNFTVNGTDYSTTVQADGSWSVDVAGSDLAVDSSFDVNVTSSDDAGNTVTSTATSTHTVDSSADAGTVKISDITYDDIVNESEAGSDITVSGKAGGGDISEGDEVSFTVNGTEYSTVVQADGSWSVDVAGTDLAADTKFEVSVESTDDAGNSVTSTETSTHTVDSSADAGTVKISDITDDDIVNASEAGSDITVSGKAGGGDISEGDEVSFTVNGTDYSTVVQADGSWSVDVAGSDLAADSSFDVSVESIDDAGNSVTSTATSTHSVDLNVGPVAVDDGSISVTGLTDLSSIDLGDLTDGASHSVTVTGLYHQGSDTNLLDGKPELVTTSSHNLGNYWPDNEEQTGYNYLGGNGWFEDNDIEATGDNFDGGIVTFSDGTVGVIDFISNGSGSSERAYIYYKPYENLGETTEISTNEDAAITLLSDDLLSNDTDANGDTLSIISVQDVEHGQVELDDDGNVIFTPESNYHGEANFSYTVSDGKGGEDTATVTLNVQSVNDLPEIDVVNTIVMDEDGSQNIIYDVTDLDGDDVVITASADNGSIVVNDGSIIFTPNENYNGSDTIIVTATDSQGGVTTEEISVTVNPINDGPQAVDDSNASSFNPSAATLSAELNFDDGIPNANVGTVSEEVLGQVGNAADFSSAKLSVGDIELNSDVGAQTTVSMWIQGNPDGGWEMLAGSELYDMVLLNGNIGFNTGVGDLFGTDASELDDGEWHHVVGVFTNGDVSQNSIYIDGVSQSMSQIQNSPNNSRANIDSDDGTLHFGSWGYNDSYRFTGSMDEIKVYDGELSADEVSGLYAIESENEHWGSASLSTDEDMSLIIDVNELLTNDTDVDGDTLTITSVQDAANGSVEINGDGDIVFTPEDNYNGEASFTYTISDGNGGTDTATVTLNVDSVNDVITQVSDLDTSSNEVSENVASGTSTGVTLNATDADGDSITYSIDDDVPFTVGSDGIIVTDGDIDFESNESFTFDVTATSADGTSSTESITINVNDIDEVAEAGTVTVSSITDDDIVNATEDNSDITVSGTASGGDISEGDAVSFTVNGNDYSTTVQADGSWSVDVAGSDLAADTSFDVNVASSDDVGNTVTSTATSTHTVDNSADAGTVTIATISGDDVINAQEDNASSIEVSGTATGGDISAGDQVTVTVNGQDYTTTVQNDSSYSVDVATSDLQADSSIEAKVDSSDDAGNAVTSNATDHNISFDSSADSGTVSVESITDDDIISSSEAGSTIAVSGSATGGDIAEGDAVSFTVNGTDYSTTVQADGSWSVDVAGSDLAADTSFDVSVESSDDAGNNVTSTATSIHTVETNDGSVTAGDENYSTYDQQDTAITGTLSSNDGVDVYTFHHNGGPLILDALTETSETDVWTDLSDSGNENYTEIDGDGEKSALDVMLAVKNSSGSTVASNDDADYYGNHTGDADYGYGDGSINGLDSYINLDDLPAGDYTIEVSSYGALSSGPYSISITGDVDLVENPFETEEGAPLVIDSTLLLSNDSDSDGDSLSITGIQSASNGTATINDDGDIVFTPDVGYHGEASFVYSVSDSNGNSDTATVTLNITEIDEEAEQVDVSLTVGSVSTVTMGSETLNVDSGLNDFANNADQYYSYNASSTINGTSGDDDVYVGNDAKKSIDLGDGDDRLYIGDDSNKTVDLGSGDDYMYVGDESKKEVYGGDGNDHIVIGGRVNKTIDGGDGNDSIELLDYSRSDYDNNWNNIQDKLENFENIKFSDGSVIGEETAFSGGGESGYEYPLTITTSLSDSDGSESISSIEVSGIPDSATLSSGTDNGDGTWSLSSDQLDGLSMTVPQSETASFDLSIEITTTESNGGDTSVTTLTTPITPGQDAGITSINTVGGDGNDNFTGGDGNDTFTGGEGHDTYFFNPFDGNDTFHGGDAGGWTDVIHLDADGDPGANPDDPWTITVDGQEVEYDLAAQALNLDPDSSGVIELNDGSELTFDGVDRIEWG